jgi:hypothetical protein
LYRVRTDAYGLKKVTCKKKKTSECQRSKYLIY